MTDMDLCFLAAKAVGIKDAVWDAEENCIQYGFVVHKHYGKCFNVWSPLLDNGDAFNLAVDLELDVVCIIRSKSPYSHAETIDESAAATVFHKYATDKYAATRRAIVLAAAEIGKLLKDAEAKIGKQV